MYGSSTLNLLQYYVNVFKLKGVINLYSDYLLTIVLLGDRAVGKSSILLRYVYVSDIIIGCKNW